MARYTYYYTKYRGFDSATEVSRTINRFSLVSGIIPVGLSVAFLGEGFSKGGIGIPITIALTVAVWAIYIFILNSIEHRLTLKAMLNELKELTPEQRKSIYSQFLGANVFSRKQFTIANELAYSLHNAECALRDCDITRSEFRTIKNNILRSYDIAVPDEFVLENDPEYAFEDVSEYSIYRDYVSSNVSWDKTDQSYIQALDYINKAKEKGDYQEVVNACKKALNHNPIAIKARYQLIFSYIQLDQYKEANTELNTLANLLIKDKNTKSSDIARLYRYYGFVRNEMDEKLLAYSCYKYSLRFEESDSAHDEMDLIAGEYGNSDLSELDYRYLIEKSDIVLFPERKQIK